MLKKIFWFGKYGETHYKLIILGIQFKFIRFSCWLKKRKNPYYEYIKNNADITKLPPAEGALREIQLANLALLKELDYVCRQNNRKGYCTRDFC